MPIGFDAGGLGGAVAAEPAAPDVPNEPTEPERWSWGEIIARFLTPVVSTRWVTRSDERVCPECGPLDGLVWEEDAGPMPPLHVNCRCERVFAFTEWRVRETPL